MEATMIIENISFEQKKDIFKNNLASYLKDIFPGYELEITVTNNPREDTTSVMIITKNFRNQIAIEDKKTIEQMVRREAKESDIALEAVVIE